MNIINNIANAVTGHSGQTQGGGRIMVSVVEGRNLARKDLFSKSDPYAVLSIHHRNSFAMFGSSQKTSVVNNNQNPVWNQTFVLDVTNPDTDLLRVKVYDQDPMSFDDLIGEVDIPLFAMVAGQQKNEWYQLAPSKGGAIHLMIQPQFGNPSMMMQQPGGMMPQGQGYPGGMMPPQQQPGYAGMPPGGMGMGMGMPPGAYPQQPGMMPPQPGMMYPQQPGPGYPQPGMMYPPPPYY